MPTGTGGGVMVRINRGELRALGHRRAQPDRGPGEFIAIWVPGRLVNTKNARLHHLAESTYKRRWRHRVADALLATGWRYPGTTMPPLRVQLLAQTLQEMDGQDGLRVALAPIVDALGECGVLTGRLERAGRGDSGREGHEFVYTQVVNRAYPGVIIRVALREEVVARL